MPKSPTTPQSLFTQWMEMQAKLSELKTEEMALRRALVATFADEQIPGTYHKILNNLDFTATIKRSYKIDPEILGRVQPKLSAEELLCIERKPTLNMKNFKLLPKTSRLNLAVIESPAAPALAVKEVK